MSGGAAALLAWGDEDAISSLPEMAWATPQYTKREVDQAGRVLVDGAASPYEYELALPVINNWRSSHSFPLNTFQVTLRHKARQFDPGALIAQRIKRLSSIGLKLGRFNTMKLSQMQDIGGCRAVVKDVLAVKHLANLYRDSSIKHKLDNEDNYISDPKPSGYRGVHLIYRYYSDKKTTYNGLKIEMQLRSPLQHAWATAVETVGTFVQQALKSSQGEEEWLRFFALMGTAIANRERSPIVPGTPSDKKELVRELRQAARSLNVVRRLATYGATLKTLEEPGIEGAHFFLLALDPEAQTVTITGFKAHELEKAANEYLATERALASTSGDVVLVSVESIAALRRAYPNYFLDTSVFIETLQNALKP